MLNNKKFVIAMVALLAIGSAGMAIAADGTSYDTTYVGDTTEVDSETGTTDTTGQTYATIQEAVNHTNANGEVKIQGGNYTLNDSVDVTANNVTVSVLNASNGNVTINGTNTSTGEVFTGEYAENVTIGQNVALEETVFASGGAVSGTQEFLSQTFMSVPYWAIGIILLLIGYVWMNEAE
jgi:hypothetical protein